jgi:hypothetical protein
MSVRSFAACLAWIAATASAPVAAQSPQPVPVPPLAAPPAMPPLIVNPMLTPTLSSPPELAPPPVPVPPPPKARHRFIVCPGDRRCPRSH